MDPRQPQHPFSRNTASPYGRTPFPPSSNQAPFPSSSHPPPAAPSYAEHQRRPSDPPYYNPPRNYGQDGPPMAGPGHTRHQSTSSIGHGTPVNRNMPPPSSPQQQAPQAPSHHGYGPPPPRAPPVSVGPPSSFPSNRDLPTLPPLNRPQSTGGSSMSISSMLGGPSREAPPSQYASPVSTSAPPNPMYGPAHASPRMGTTGPDYAPFRRPQTPEHQRPYDPRDNRANSASAGSPPNMNHHYTPEGRKFGTPQQGYGQRVEERREPTRIQNPSVPPPRPNSQPSAFSHGPHRVPENPRPTHQEGLFGRRVENVSRAPEPHRQEPGYGRPGFEERHGAYGYAERERQEREAAMQRERERLERDREREREREREIAIQREREQRDRAEQEYAHEMARRNAQQAAYNRPPEPAREQHNWNRGHPEPPRPEYDQPPPAERRYEYPGSTGPQYSGPPPAYASNEPRYGPAPQPTSAPHQTPPTTHYEATASLQERLRIAQQQQQQQQQEQQHRLQYGGPPPAQYQTHESPQRRPVEDSQQLQQQRNFLNVQELNRRGRASPLPQAVQGVQGQLNGPGSEPSIKNEFGKMFSGIGSGVGAAMGVPSPVSAGPQGMPFSNSGQLRREDLESLQDSPVETGAHKIIRSASRGGRRRKLKEEDSKGDDESSTGRRTPSGRGKRAKTHHHHHHHHHHHRTDAADNASSPSQSNLTPFKSAKGSTVPSPPGLEKANPNVHHHHVPRHHHHHVTPAKPPPQTNTVIPIPKTTIRNKAVLDSVAHLPRNNLGHGYYKSTIKPGRTSVKRDLTPGRGFASTPEALPNFEGSENSIYTIRIPRIHLGQISREEITRRRAVWGTDIYTDDSDIIAACIHQGWFRGAWSDDVDVSLLDLVIDASSKNGDVQKPINLDETLTAPPPTGPMEVPENRDCHVTILVLPALEGYASLTRFGIKSREWGVKRDGYQGIHDGLSFMIASVKWVKGVDGQEARSGNARSKIFSQQLNEQELDDEAAEAEFLLNAPVGHGRFEESDVRSGFTGIGTKSWWKGSNGTKKGKEKQPSKEPDSKISPPVEPKDVLGAERGHNGEPQPDSAISRPADVNEQQQQIDRITERMVANANTASAPATPDNAGFTESIKAADEVNKDGDNTEGVGRQSGMGSAAKAILTFGLDGKGGSVGSIPI
ncbi:histone deacetylation protein Rxt3-domain-containing protein [Cadophora sp. MPI-SDFR-AT-0126]|nr:histone deacetylation protein Rxt3-domain-containing protein [Leotiomycetes sp. MPI-SDFR-AT-0126]